jgi:hypothetical protein
VLDRPVDWASVGIGFVVAAVILGLGLLAFARRSDEFPDLV